MVPNHATQTDPYLHECKGATTATAGQVLTATGSGTAIFQSGSGVAGSVIKTSTTTSVTLVTGTTLIPIDNTIPQLTEGVNLFAVAFAPTTTGNKIRISATIFGAYSVAAQVSAALYQDSTANALAAVATKVTAANDSFSLRLEWEITAASTSATIFKINVGGSTAGTVSINGNAGAGIFGGVAASSLVITEIKV